MASGAPTPVCRGCLSTDQPLRSMFELHLHEHYAIFTNIQVQRWEGLSELLCAECERALLECRRFRACCQKSDVILRSDGPQKPLPQPKVGPKSPQLGCSKSKNKSADPIRESAVKFVFTEQKLTLFITPSDLESNHEGNLICPYNCKTVYTRRNNLLTHLVKLHGVDETKFSIECQYYCPYSNCAYGIESGKNKYFSAKKVLKSHIANLHKSRDILCDDCGESFALETELRRHRIVCSERYVCTICNIEYKSNERLLVHLMRKHPDVHKEYKKQRKELRHRSKSNKRKFTDEHTNSKKVKPDPNIESRSTQTSKKVEDKLDIKKNTSEYMFDCSPKRTFATQTFELKSIECVKNDISLGSCVAHSPLSLKHLGATEKVANYELNDVFALAEERVHSSTIETQTVFEDLLSIRSQNSEDEFETVSLSDIQTQTWPMEFGISSPLKQKNTSETQTNPFTTTLELARGLNASPDLSFKETQTCFCFLDSPKQTTSLFNFPKSIFESTTSSPVGCTTSTETQTADADGFSRRKDVLLSYHSIETQTCDVGADGRKSLGI